MSKTTLLFHLLERPRDSARTAFLFHPQCNSLELLRHLLADLGIESDTQDVVEMHHQLNKLVPLMLPPAAAGSPPVMSTLKD